MKLTPEEIERVKSQLYEQIQSLPEDQKVQAKAQIDSMSPEAIEALVEQQRSKAPGKENKTIFRMIIDKEIQSVEVDENKESLAVLDINPVSKGHIIVIPKAPIENSKSIPNSAFSLAKKIGAKITKKLNAKEIEITTEKKFGESVIHIIPSYNSQVNLSSPRQKTAVPELESIASLLRPKKRIRRIKIKNPAKLKINLPQRIP